MPPPPHSLKPPPDLNLLIFALNDDDECPYLPPPPLDEDDEYVGRELEDDPPDGDDLVDPDTEQGSRLLPDLSLCQPTGPRRRSNSTAWTLSGNHWS